MLSDADSEVAVEGLEDDVDRVAPGLARVGLGRGAREVGDEDGQRTSPRNWTTEASTPVVVATASSVASASPMERESSTTSGAKSSAESASNHHRRIRVLPPWRKRVSTSPVGRRRMPG